MEIDLSNVRNTFELHDLLAQTLRFPEFYGRNWDAFWDCVSDPSLSTLPPTLRLTGWTALSERLPRDARILRECLAQLVTERPDCLVEWAA